MGSMGGGLVLSEKTMATQWGVVGVRAKVKALPHCFTIIVQDVAELALPIILTHTGFPDPSDPHYPQPLPEKTCTLANGCRFLRVRVRVALKNPRVTHANP